MAKLQLNPAQQEKVKKALVTAATGPIGSTMGQAGKAAQTFGLPMFEGEKMPAGGMLLEGGITRKPQTKASQATLPTIINIGGDRPIAFELDDLVAQGKVLEQRYGKDSPMYKLYKNLISEKGATTTTKLDQRKNPESSVDTVQTNLGIYAPYSGKGKNKEYKNLTPDEMGVLKNKFGQTKGTDFATVGRNDMPSGGLMTELVKFLTSRGVKRARSLKIEEGNGYFENKPEK